MSEQGCVAGCCERGNKSYVSIKDQNFLNLLTSQEWLCFVELVAWIGTVYYRKKWRTFLMVVLNLLHLWTARNCSSLLPSKERICSIELTELCQSNTGTNDLLFRCRWRILWIYKQEELLESIIFTRTVLLCELVQWRCPWRAFVTAVMKFGIHKRKDLEQVNSCLCSRGKHCNGFYQQVSKHSQVYEWL
jgi:hypothetical protein